MPVIDDLQVAVNLSAVQFNREDLVEKIIRACSKVGIDPAYLNLEITESSLVEKFEVVLRVMKQMSLAGIVALAKSLQLQVVAEGVETEAQKAILTSLGCHEGQGKLFSEPLSRQEASKMLQSFNRDPG
ncbi:MAG: EAL domain-containing protein [Candidatus Thiodiazotropha sp. (ex Gloverina cf. vestifex)]|nr:EAL domain-containing protein [Candidatus Thiodiazotropha sp. (ex Gloverina cf. vestifex)]